MTKKNERQSLFLEPSMIFYIHFIEWPCTVHRKLEKKKSQFGVFQQMHSTMERNIIRELFEIDSILLVYFMPASAVEGLTFNQQ